jgi:hypothetical protein
VTVPVCAVRVLAVVRNVVSTEGRRKRVTRESRGMGDPLGEKLRDESDTAAVALTIRIT